MSNNKNEISKDEVLDLFIGLIDALDARKFKKLDQIGLAAEITTKFLNAKTGLITVDGCPGCMPPGYENGPEG